MREEKEEFELIKEDNLISDKKNLEKENGIIVKNYVNG